MASESSAGFHHQHGGLFKPGGATSTSSSGSGGCELISLGNYNYGGGSINLGGNECPNGRIFFAAQNSLDSSMTHVLDSLPGLKHDTGFAVEWLIDEQYKLEEGLAKYGSEPNIVKYIKIAASLRDKTVRDVALRSKWMMRKRRKQEHPCLGKKVKDRKLQTGFFAHKMHRSPKLTNDWDLLSFFTVGSDLGLLMCSSSKWEKRKTDLLPLIWVLLPIINTCFTKLESPF